MQFSNARRNLVTAGAGAVTALGVTAAVLAAPASAATPHASAHAGASASRAAATLSRATEMKRAKAWINNKSYTYSDGTYPGPGGKGRYRGDCSGFVSMALELPQPGPNTVSLTSYVHAIKSADLKEGDLIGNLGAGTAGQAGHVQIFVKWANSKHTSVVVAEQGHLAGSAPDYPHEKTYAYPEHMSSGKQLKAYRYNKIS